jgi:predicted TPR repeat methyltransferase
LSDSLACDNPIAERRYGYARSAAAEGDWATAAEVLEQTIELAPDWAPAWFGLGEARERLGDGPGAADAFDAALEADPSDALGAAGRLALLQRGPTLGALSPAYVARLFDDYAPRFEAHLTGELLYRGPELIVAALERLDATRRFSRCLDLGCGTGLAGAAVRGRVDTLLGVDLSPGMIARARDAGLYDALEVGDAIAFLASQPAGVADLVVAADVLPYMGDIAPLFAAGGRALAPDGLFVVSVEAVEGETYELGRSMRFAHSEAYLRAVSTSAGLRPRLMTNAIVRREAGLGVAGWIWLFQSAADPASVNL